MTLIQLRSSAVFSSSEIGHYQWLFIAASMSEFITFIPGPWVTTGDVQEFRAMFVGHERSLSHIWCSWVENSELCGTFTHLIWDAIPWLSVTHGPYLKNRMWGTPSKTIFYSFISGIWVKIWLRPNGTPKFGPWGRHESSIVFITPAPKIKKFHRRFHFSVNRTLFFAVIEGVPFTVVPYDSGLRV